MIPKLLHMIWVGDESKCPTNCIDTWRAMHPEWQVVVWGNRELNELEWVNHDHMMEMYSRELNGVADMMRWEILYANGGIVVDADSAALRPIDDHLLDCEAFACWENEIARPGLIAAGYFGCTPGNPFVRQIIEDIAAEPTVTHDMAWKTVGPMRLTDSYRKYRYTKLRIYPSHYFIPEHFSGVAYDGGDPVYAHQLWGSTRQTYEMIHTLDLSGIAGTTSADRNTLAGVPVQSVQPSRVPAEQAPSAASPGSKLETLHDPYFVQHVPVSREIAHLGRHDVLRSLCHGKRVLHVGCADWPITDPRTSLHLALEQVCARIDGVDPHTEALQQLAPFTRGRLFGSLAEVADSYDIVLVPEVMEHVADVATFLNDLYAINATTFLISVPDAFQCRGGHFDYVANTETFVEVVHPDHNVWYTPYTFTNTIRKYSSFNVERMWFFNGISLLAMLSKTQLRMAA